MVETKNNEELRHLVRIMNTDLQGAKPVQYALTGLPGVGRRTAILIARGAGVNPAAILGYLPDEDVAKLDDAIGKLKTLSLAGC